MKSRFTSARRGSIAVVIGLCVVIAALCAGTLLLSSGANRADKRSELHQVARAVATAACEEVMLRLVNGAERWPEMPAAPVEGVDRSKSDGTPSGVQALAVPAPATYQLYNGHGVKVQPVRILGRPLPAAAADPVRRNKLYGYLSAGPRFESDIPNWESQVQDPRIRRLMRLPDGVNPDPETRSAMLKIEPMEAIDDKILERLRHVSGGGLLNGLRLAAEQIVEKAATAESSCGNLVPQRGAAAALAFLSQGFDLSAKENTKAPQVLEAMIKESLEGEVFHTDTVLVSLEAHAVASAERLEVDAPVVTYRIFSKLRYEEPMRYAYGRFLGYLNVHAKVTYENMREAGLLDESGQVVAAKVLPAVEGRYPMRGAQQPWPFPLATASSRAVGR